MSELRRCYKELRSSTNRHAFSLLIAYIHRRCDFKMTHFCVALIYNVLEKEYIQVNDASVQNVDISVKKLLSARDASQFYGSLFPYFDPVRFIKRLVPSGGLTHQAVALYRSLVERVPELIKYLVLVSSSILGFYMDFIKDIIIASGVSFLYSETEPFSFTSLLVTVLWITVFLSQIIIGIKLVLIGPSRLFGSRQSSLPPLTRIILTLFLLVVSPVAPALLLFLNSRLSRKLRLKEKEFLRAASNPINNINSEILLHCHAEQRSLWKQKNFLEEVIGSSYQLDIALENTPQVLIQVLIVLLATATIKFPWVSGVEAVFDTHDGTSSLSTVLFYLSIFWSLRSIHSGIFSTFLFKKDYSVGDLGKVLMFLTILLGATARIFAIVLAFTPFLGLFDIMLPHHLDSRFQFSSEVWSKYQGTLELSRDYTWYTGIQFRTFLVLMITFPIIHVLIVNSFKVCYLDKFRGKISLRSLYNLTIHSFSSMIIPIVYRDWDDIPGRGCTDVFLGNWRTVRNEYLGMVCIHYIENLILCLPVCLTSARNLQRLFSIPVSAAEYHVVYLSGSVLCLPVLLLLLALLQFKLFLLYNQRGHPWSRLLHHTDKSL